MATSANATDCAKFDQIARHQTPKNATCALYQGESGNKGSACSWAFAFRDPAAVAFAKSLWGDLTICESGAAGKTDQQVNHPDSYDLRRWQTDNGQYAISVKDKGALNKTYVFLRFE